MLQAHVWYSKIQQVSIRGTPDILLCLAGKFIAIEMKASETAKISELQTYNLSKIQKAGGIAVVAYPENWENIYSYLTDIANKH